MSPVNSNERPPRRDLMINGQRPSPLKINKDSHPIQKSSAPPPNQQQQRKGPVIIYTHSPKIIHTQARDFMALVQKLTGFSRSDKDLKATAPSKPRNNKLNNENNRQEANDSSSVVTEENCGVGDVNNVSSSLTTTAAISPPNPFFADMPLFTPNSADFFCSPRPVYKFSDITIVSPTLGNLSSPSMLEFMKGLPDY